MTFRFFFIIVPAPRHPMVVYADRTLGFTGTMRLRHIIIPLTSEAPMA